ncbi:InlB B-repeat-containing protein [bacterium]|nr:InlB B-repeat-containing protein [bacterium]
MTRGSTGDREFTANWTANQYFIKFDGNGGTVAKPRIAGDFGSNIEIPADPTREGYTFA